MRLSGLIIEKGGERFIWSSVEDITEQKRAEAALLQAKESAEQAKLVAEMASRAKSTFLANMSHELRTPLNAIIGYSEILQEDLAEAEQLEFIPDLQKIRSAGEHLLRLISDVLDISRIEAGKVVLNLETFDIKQMVQETVETITPLLKENNNTLHLYYGDDLGLLHTDLTKIRQSLLNLLNNANKFTENGNIYLSITQENYNDVTWINFSVKDTGIGMTAEQSSKLFQAFVQIDDAPTRKYGGTGLGLAITKHFIQKMGGTIEVESHYGEGSVFTIRLPISQ